MGLFGEDVPKTAENFVSWVPVETIVRPPNSRLFPYTPIISACSALSVLERRELEHPGSPFTTRDQFSTVSVSSPEGNENISSLSVKLMYYFSFLCIE